MRILLLLINFLTRQLSFGSNRFLKTMYLSFTIKRKTNDEEWKKGRLIDVDVHFSDYDYCFTPGIVQVRLLGFEQS